MTSHEFTAMARCPVNGSLDCYQVTVATIFDIQVEKILAVAAKFREERIYQEDFTRQLFVALANAGVVVTTVGYHSGVKTTCQIPSISVGR